MNKRILSVLCCLTLLFSFAGGLGVVAETSAELQACVSGATLTAIDGAADAALLPTGDNLLAGLSKISGSSGSSAGSLSFLYDGLYQGINQDVAYQKNEDGSWKINDPRYNQVVTNVTDTRYVSYVVAATETTMGYAQIGFDLGSLNKLDKITVAGSAEPANSKANQAKFSDPDFDGVETDFTKDTRLHMIDVYVSASVESLYDDANKVVSADYLNGDISAYKNSLAPLASLFTLDEAVTGRFVGFRMYVAGVDGSNGISTTINGKTAKWGWYSQVRISELGVFGEPAGEEVELPYTRVPVTSVDDLPGESLIAGLTPTLPDGKKPNIQSGGKLENLTDGLIQGINQNVFITLTQDDADKTATSSGNTYYSWIAPTSMVAAQGLDTTQTWYVKPANGRWMGSNTDSQRAVLYGGSSNGANVIYDLGEEAIIDSLLLASSVEPNGLTNNTYYNGDYDASKHPVMTEAQAATANTPAVDNRLLYKAKIYVSNDRDTLFSEENVVLDFDLSHNYNLAWRNLWELKESASGRYVGFGLNDTIMSASNPLVRISELGVYGQLKGDINVETAITETNADKGIAAADNILANATIKASAQESGKTPNLLVDGIATGITVPYSGNESKCWCPIVGSVASGANVLYVTYTLDNTYSIESFQLCGAGVAAYGAEGFELYAGKAYTDLTAEDEPIYAYKNNVTYGYRVDLAKPVTTDVLTIKAYGKGNAGNYQLWLSEMMAKGTVVAPATPDPVVITTYNAANMAANMTSKEDNILGQAVGGNYRLGATGTPTKDGKFLGALVDGSYGGSAAEKLCPASNEYIYFTYDMGKIYSFDTLTYVGDGSDGANSVAVYVSTDDWATAYENGIEPTAFYDGAIGTTSRQTNNKTDAIGLRFTFNTPALGRYVTFRLQGCRNGGSLQVWAAEFAATGKDGTVAPYNAAAAPSRIPSADKNILASAADAYYRAGNANYNSKNDALKNELVNGAMSATAKTMLTVADDYVYVTYDMGVPYDITSLLYAGDGNDGANSVAIWVGNDKLAAIISKGVEPTAFYDGGVGISERVTNNKTDAVAVGFNLTVTGRYITFRLGTCKNASYQQVWISEFAATGKPSPISASKTETIVCVGDSITHGTVFTSPDNWNAIQLANGYPAQLEQLLNASSEDVHYNVINAGISASAVIGVDQTIPGTDTKFPNSGNAVPTTWLVEQETRGLNYVQEADKVLIMLGTNDAHANNGAWTARAPYYKEYYKKIIDAFREKNPDVEIYIVTSPYTSVSTHKNNLANGVVPLQKKMAADWGLPLIDVYEASKYHVEVLNNGDLSSFIDDMDIAHGLNLHPDEEGQGVIAKACFDALTGDQNDLYVIGFEGAQIRGYEGGVPTGNMALRFGMSMPATGITMNANYATQLSDASQITIGGKTYTVTGFGTVVAVKDKLTITREELVAGVKDDWAKDVPAKKLYSADENGITYTAVVTGINEDCYDSTLVARGYVQYRDGDEVCYAYGPLVTRSVSEVIEAFTMDQMKPTYDEWLGYKRMTFTAGGVECYLVLPEEPAEGNPWIWRTEFFGAGSVTSNTELLDAGWVVGYCRVSNMYGNPKSVGIMKQFYNVAVPMLNLKRRVVLEGLSRGGLYAVNYAATYPNDVAGLYLDAPVQDVCSWPGSLYSNNQGDAGCWSGCKSSYGFTSDAQALADRTASPRWKYNILLENNIPVLLVYGDADNVVPFAENGQHLVDAYTAAGKTDLLKVQCFTGRGHSHGWEGGASAHIIEAMS